MSAPEPDERTEVELEIHEHLGTAIVTSAGNTTSLPERAWARH
jgi:hypothetical protein